MSIDVMPLTYSVRREVVVNNLNAPTWKRGEQAVFHRCHTKLHQ